MRWRVTWQPQNWASVLLGSGLLLGCSTSEKNLTYVGEAELQHYKDVVTSIDYPAIDQETPDEVSFSDEPRRIRNPRKDEVWDLSLEEAIHTALANSEIIRDNGQFLNPGNRLMSNPDFVQSVYDPALQDTSTLFGQNGVEAALSEFDAQFTTNFLVGRSSNLLETAALGGFAAGEEQSTDFGDFRATLSKIYANGGQLSLQHNVLYQAFNKNVGGTRLFQSYFTNNPSASQNGGLAGIGITYTQPLWSGGGTRFTRIAGPISRRPTLQNVPQVNQGVVISRIRTDIALAEFEQATLNLVKDTEDLYWELYLAYRRYDAELTARNSALQTWREVKAKADQGLEGGGAADEAQARDSYFEARSRAEEALSNLYNTEGRFRRLIGLPVNDGRIIRPADEPTTAEFMPDWRACLVEALTRRIELRKQKWNLKSLELQLEAARSLTNPRLDFVSRYQINGFGDKLFGNSDQTPTPSVTGSFYDNLLSGKQDGWGVGFEFSMPIGFRAAHSQVRNLELRLAKNQAALSAQEFEISHELANAFRQLDTGFQTAQTNFNRRRAAERRLQAYEAQYRAGKGNVDLLLRSQISLAQAETAYYQSLVSYNRAIVELKYRKGTLLSDNNIYLGESLSHPEAYIQALRHAWARSYAIDAKHLQTQPEEFATDESDPVELGERTSHAPAMPDGPSPVPPVPVPNNELPPVERRPLPTPAAQNEAEVPAALPSNASLKPSEYGPVSRPNNVQPATERQPKPRGEAKLEQIKFQPAAPGDHATPELAPLIIEDNQEAAKRPKSGSKQLLPEPGGLESDHQATDSR
jgi:outer membrane protein TolC